MVVFMLPSGGVHWSRSSVRVWVAPAQSQESPTLCPPPPQSFFTMSTSTPRSIGRPKIDATGVVGGGLGCGWGGGWRAEEEKR